MLAAAVGGAIITVAGGALSYGLTSLFAAPPPSSSSNASIAGGTAQTSPTYTLQAQGNASSLGSPIPELFGRNFVYPSFATAPYARYDGNFQYLSHILVVGVGEYTLNTVNLGDTPITSFSPDVVYEIIAPGGLGDPTIADPRWIPSQDVGDIELLAANEFGGWSGPFAILTQNALVDRMEIDWSAPRGLYGFNDSTGSFDSRQFTVEVEAQEIDSAGAPIGSWTLIDTITHDGNTNQPLFWTDLLMFPSASRWQVRVQRTDDRDMGIQAGDEAHWIGLRGYLTTERRFDGVTLLAVRMKAGPVLQNVARRINCDVTRRLPTWTGSAWSALADTRNPCDAIAWIARSQNGGRLDDSQIDIAGLYANYATFNSDGWTFDFIFDQVVTVQEALRKVARAVVGEIVVQGGQVRLVLDRAVSSPVMMFGPRNITPSSLELDYKMVDQTSADGITATFIDPLLGWKPRTLTVAFDDSAQERLTQMNLEGVTNIGQARNVLWYLVRANRYRRRTVRFTTEMEGLMCLYGDGVAFAHDLPNWGQTMEIAGWDDDTRTATLVDPPVFTAGATHYVAIRDSEGLLTGPFEATAVDGDDSQIVIGVGTLPDILTGGDRERTFVQFGPGESYTKRVKVIQVTPRDFQTAELICIDDDPRMYDAVPEDGSAPPGSPQTALAITISADDSDVDLRILANVNGYTGLMTQAVTITINHGVTLGASDASAAAVIRGTWPPRYTGLTLINRGHIDGADAMSGRGGTALDVRSGPTTINNVGGRLKGGTTNGYALRGNANVTWTGVDTGERIGPIG